MNRTILALVAISSLVPAALGGCSSSSPSTGGGGSSSSGGGSSGGNGSSSGSNANCGGNVTTSGYASGTFTAGGYSAQIDCVGLNVENGGGFNSGKELRMTVGTPTGTVDGGAAAVKFQASIGFDGSPSAQTYGPTDTTWCSSIDVEFNDTTDFNAQAGDQTTCGGTATGTLTLVLTDASAPHGTLSGTLVDTDTPAVTGTLQLTF